VIVHPHRTLFFLQGLTDCSTRCEGTWLALACLLLHFIAFVLLSSLPSFFGSLYMRKWSLTFFMACRTSFSWYCHSGVRDMPRHSWPLSCLLPSPFLLHFSSPIFFYHVTHLTSPCPLFHPPFFWFCRCLLRALPACRQPFYFICFPGDSTLPSSLTATVTPPPFSYSHPGSVRYAFPFAYYSGSLYPDL